MVKNQYGASVREKSMDWILLTIYLVLLFIGWLMVYTVGYRDDPDFSVFNIDYAPGRQLLFVGLSLLLFFIIAIIDWKFWRSFSYFIYLFALVLLGGVLIFGATIKGATAWYTFMGFSFQPVEIAKFGTALALSNYLSSGSINLNNTKEFSRVLAFLLLPVGLIMLQPDAGSALIFISFFILFFREGLSPVVYIIGAVLFSVFIGALLFDITAFLTALVLTVIFLMILTKRHKTYWLIGFVVLVVSNVLAYIEDLMLYAIILDTLALLAISFMIWQRGESRLVMTTLPSLMLCVGLAYAADFTFNKVMLPHQQDRINVWLHPDKCDPRGSLYNLLQSKMAIGSGGFSGKGFKQGTLTKLNYVPEQTTDFIFCTIGEEYGFIGSAAIIILFMGMLFRIVVIAERQRLLFVRHYAYCVAGIVFFHFFINIGMTMGLVPVIGIPLPFLSYGGSSLLGFTLLLGVLLKLDTTR